MLGGKGGHSKVENREPTEIEWSLLEEVVRVIARALGEAWQVFHEVDFKVESLESDPARLPNADAALTDDAHRIHAGARRADGKRWRSRLHKHFLNCRAPQEIPESTDERPAMEEIQRNLELLEDAAVHLEVTLEGPTMAFSDLTALKTGQVVKFDYPLGKQLQALVNGSVPITGHIVSSGRKRAFQVEELP